MSDLENFAKWFLNESPRFGLIPTKDAVTYIEDVTSVLWYREGPFQVQQFIVPPHYIIPAHTHPNVDSMELYLGGEMEFTCGGKFLISEEEAHALGKYGEAAMRGRVFRIRPNDPHGGKFGPNGGVFMSIQHWLNGVKPHCVSLDYNGQVMGADHFEKVKSGKPIMAEQKALTKKNALLGA